MSEVRNAFGDEWDDLFPQLEGWRSRVRRLVPPGNGLGLSVYELAAGQTQCPYHFHHGSDELILVLRGRVSLRTPAGEQELGPGDVVHFPKGPAGAHLVANPTREPARYVVASASVSPDVVEYPDSGKLAAMSRGDAHGEGRLWSIHRLGEAVDYLEGEEPSI